MPLHYILWICAGVIPFPIIVTPWVLGCRQPRTPNSESSPHCDSTTLSNLHCLRVCTRSCHSQLIDYIIIVRLTAWPFYLCPSSSGHNPDSALSLHRTFTIILFVLRDNSKFWDGILSIVIIAFFFTISLAWCRRRAIASSWRLLTKFVLIIINILTPSRISIEFMMRNTILALDDLSYHRPVYCLPSNTNMIVFCVIPWVPCYPAFVLLYLGVLPSFMSRMLW